MYKKYEYPDKNDELTIKHIKKYEYAQGYWDKSERYVLKKALRILKIKNNEKILDIGCGEGRLIPIFSKLTQKIIGIEPDNKRYAKAKQFIKKLKIKNCILQNKELLETKYPGETFNAILCSHILQHVSTKKLNPMIAEMSRILKKQGILIILTAHSKKRNSLLLTKYEENGKLQSKITNEDEFNKLITNKKIILPIHLFTIKEIKERLYKFKIKKTLVFHELSKKSILDKIIFRDKWINLPLLKNYRGSDIIIIAQKNQ